MGAIDNREELCSHGDTESRKLLVDIVDGALDAVHPGTLVPRTVALSDGTLTVDGTPYELDAVGDLLVVGAGKGSAAVVEALQGVLGDRITGGIVVEKRGQGRDLDGLDVREAGHPIPDGDSRRAAEAVTRLAEDAGPDDLVIACITGGASALLSLPAAGITLDEMAATTRILLNAGAPIEDVNAVRKHLSQIKGGRLAAAIHPATVVSLIVVDEVAGEPWGPTVPDPTTFDDAIDALERHDIRDRVPGSVVDHLEAGRDRPDLETPTGETLARGQTQTVVLADASDVCEAACARAEGLGINAMLLSTMIEGESREVGTCLAGIAKEVAAHGRPVEPPCAIVSGGETTVALGDQGAAGEGGPNQELALGVALGIDGLVGCGAIAIGTDGTDGPTDIAGGLVDGRTVDRAERRGIDLHAGLTTHDAAPLLRTLGDAVVTGPTGTNLMDLRVVLVRDTGQGHG